MAMNWCWSFNCFKTFADEQTDSNVSEIDFSNCGLIEVPTHIFLYERTLEKLFLNSNRITELPRILCNCLALKILNLSDNQLTVLPDALSSLQSLEYLDISRNQISKLRVSLRDCKELRVLNMGMNPITKLPDVVTQISSLEELYLNDMDLGFLPANIGRMTRLKILEVRANRLSTLPAALGRLIHLSRLDIGQNEFEQVPPAVKHLTRLKELWCDFNPLAGSDNLCTLENLTHLEAGDNLLTAFLPGIHFCIGLVHVTLTCNHITVIPDEIGKLKSLVTLKLDMNDLITLPCTIGELRNLEELHLSENYIKTLPSAIGLLRNLIILHLDSNSLRKLPPEIGSCTKLRILSLQDNKLKRVPPEIGNLSNLRVLSLARNNLEHLPLSVFKLKNLKSLWLSYNQGLPLTPLCKTFDGETGGHFATNYLLPQRNLDYDGNELVPEKEQDRREKMQPFIKFNINVDLVERNSGFTRVPTPYPKRPKKQSKNVKPEENGSESQVVPKEVESAVAEQQVPSPSRSIVRTAVVRRQIDESALNCSRTDSDECHSREKSDEDEEASTSGVVEELAHESSYEMSASSSKEVADLFCTDEEDGNKLVFNTQHSDSELSSAGCFRPISSAAVGQGSGSMDSLPHSTIEESYVETENQNMDYVDSVETSELRNICLHKKFSDSNRSVNESYSGSVRTVTTATIINNNNEDVNKIPVSNRNELTETVNDINRTAVNLYTGVKCDLTDMCDSNNSKRTDNYISLGNISSDHYSDLNRRIEGRYFENNCDIKRTDECSDLNEIDSSLLNDPEGKYWASVAVCTNKTSEVTNRREEKSRPSSSSDEHSSLTSWAFGVHKNVTVIEIIVEKSARDLGLSLTTNQAGFVVVEKINESDLVATPNLRIGDKILQIESIDVAVSNLEYVRSLINSQRKSFSILVSRFA